MKAVALLQRGKPCHWCRRPMRTDTRWLCPTRDHVVPRSRYREGQTSIGNVVWACLACNDLKGDMTPEAWRALMRQVPEWWNLAERRGPRGTALHIAMIECGFDMPPVPLWPRRMA